MSLATFLSNNMKIGSRIKKIIAKIKGIVFFETQCICNAQREWTSDSRRWMKLVAQELSLYAAFTPDTCSPDTSCIHLYPLSPSILSCIGDKSVVTATCIHLYPRVEHCLELVSVYIGYPSNRRIQVARPGYLYPATWIRCKRGFTCMQTNPCL